MHICMYLCKMKRKKARRRKNVHQRPAVSKENCYDQTLKNIRDLYGGHHINKESYCDDIFWCPCFGCVHRGKCQEVSSVHPVPQIPVFGCFCKKRALFKCTYFASTGHLLISTLVFF